MTLPLVSFNHLSVSFAGERHRVRAVQDVSFTIQAGQTVGVVGESGCGKSVTAMALMGLLPSQAARIDGGEIRFADRDLLRLNPRQMADLRGHQLAMIFQEPMSALNPVLTIGEQLCEPAIRHLGATPKAARQLATRLLSEVGLARGDSLMASYPHQLSGGMLQRVMIAMALSCQPKLLIADEPTTALDVTVQAQILRLLRDRARASQMAMMLITHDRGDRADGRTGGGDVCREDRGTGRHGGGATPSAAPLYAWAHRLPPGTGRAASATVLDSRSGTGSGRPAGGLRFCRALRTGDAALPGGDSAAARRAPAGRLLL